MISEYEDKNDCLRRVLSFGIRNGGGNSLVTSGAKHYYVKSSHSRLSIICTADWRTNHQGTKAYPTIHTTY